MTKLSWAPLLIALVALPASADTAEDLDSWFRDGYANLYVENSWEHADEFAQYIADVITLRSDDGLVELDVNSFVVDSLDRAANGKVDYKHWTTHAETEAEPDA